MTRRTPWSSLLLGFLIGTFAALAVVNSPLADEPFMHRARSVARDGFAAATKAITSRVG